MRNILFKEIKLSASILSFIFILFGLIFFLPGYPVLCGVFFVTLGIFKSFQNIRENNDIVFSSLLPIAKHDIVKGKYLLVCLIELCSTILMAIATVLRMTVLCDMPAYKNNALMNANLFALGVALVIFGLFNWIFVRGFFKTAYKFGLPFIIYIFVCFFVITVSESLHYFPGLSRLNAFGFEHFGFQISMFLIGAIIYSVITLLSYKKSCKYFEKIDL